MQEAVCGDQLNATVFRPAAQQRLQNTCSGTFTDRHAARDADDIRNTLAVSAKELLQYRLATQVGAYIEVKQAGQWQIDLCNLLQRQVFVDPL
ncbi:hypothetical protein D3C72_1396650 [compost metagenome]